MLKLTTSTNHRLSKEPLNLGRSNTHIIPCPEAGTGTAHRRIPSVAIPLMSELYLSETKVYSTYKVWREILNLSAIFWQ